MPMSNPERAIATLTGTYHALFMSIQAIAKTHPNAQALLSELETVSQLGLASLEPHPIPDATIQGFLFVIDAVRKSTQQGLKGG